MDKEFAMQFQTTSQSACADCKNRSKDDKKAGYCAVFTARPKPARVFRGIPCDYYEKEVGRQ